MVKMAEVKYFIYCEGVQNIFTPEGSKMSLNNPLLVLTPRFIPGTFTFSISFGIQGFDQTAQNKLQIIFKDPSDTIIQDTGTVELPVAPKGNLPSEYVGISLSIDYRNIVINCDGEYSSTLVFNGETLGTYKIPVVKSSDKK